MCTLQLYLGCIRPVSGQGPCGPCHAPALYTPPTTYASLVALLGLCRVQGAYVSTNRELKRLDALAFSPIFQSFGETLAGLATIRAFGKQQQFRHANLVGAPVSSVFLVLRSHAHRFCRTCYHLDEVFIHGHWSGEGTSTSRL